MSDLSWLGKLWLLWLKQSQNSSAEREILYFRIFVQNLKHSEATFALFLFLSLSDSFLLVAVSL